jgi:hypothetical protein
MKKAELDAVKLVRAIRDRPAAQLKGKSAQEIIEFYNTRGRQPVKAAKGRTSKARRSA